MELFVRIPDVRTTSALAVAFHSLANQLQALPQDAEFRQIKLDKDTKTVRVSLTGGIEEGLG